MPEGRDGRASCGAARPFFAGRPARAATKAGTALMKWKPLKAVFFIIAALCFAQPLSAQTEATESAEPAQAASGDDWLRSPPADGGPVVVRAAFHLQEVNYHRQRRWHGWVILKGSVEHPSEGAALSVIRFSIRCLFALLSRPTGFPVVMSWTFDPSATQDLSGSSKGGFRCAQASSTTLPVELYVGPPAEPVVYTH
jgi:hypothetical protein